MKEHNKTTFSSKTYRIFNNGKIKKSCLKLNLNINNKLYKYGSKIYNEITSTDMIDGNPFYT